MEVQPFSHNGNQYSDLHITEKKQNTSATSPLKHSNPHAVCLLQAMVTVSLAWPPYGSPSVLAGLSTSSSMAGPLFNTCVIFCTLGMNSITMVACFLFFLFSQQLCIACVYSTGSQHLPQALGFRRKGDFFPSKITHHGALTSLVTLVIKSCWGP